MTLKCPQAMEFLLSRRSRPFKTLTIPVPTRNELMPILTAAARTPDHGKLEPWRFMVLERDALRRIGAVVADRARATGLDEAAINKAQFQYMTSDLAVAVVEIQKDHPTIPPIELTYSAGATCLALLNAALASGWGANWLTGWAVFDETVMRDGFQLADNESIAGLIHIGTETNAPPERPRPDLDKIVSWISK